MASYRPYDRNGSRRSYRRNKPWCARRRRNDIEFVLGYFDTREEAEAIESEFEKNWPSGRGHFNNVYKKAG